MGRLADPSLNPRRHSCVRNVELTEGREKMNEAIRNRNPRATVATVVLAVLVLLAVAFLPQPDTTTGASSPAVHPGIHATSAGGPDITEDPYIDRHAELVVSYQQDGPR
jgi:hypothetical protein